MHVCKCICDVCASVLSFLYYLECVVLLLFEVMLFASSSLFSPPPPPTSSPILNIYLLHLVNTLSLHLFLSEQPVLLPSSSSLSLCRHYALLSFLPFVPTPLPLHATSSPILNIYLLHLVNTLSLHLFLSEQPVLLPSSSSLSLCRHYALLSFLPFVPTPLPLHATSSPSFPLHTTSSPCHFVSWPLPPLFISSSHHFLSVDDITTSSFSKRKSWHDLSTTPSIELPPFPTFSNHERTIALQLCGWSFGNDATQSLENFLIKWGGVNK